MRGPPVISPILLISPPTTEVPEQSIEESNEKNRRIISFTDFVDKDMIHEIVLTYAQLIRNVMIIRIKYIKKKLLTRNEIDDMKVNPHKLHILNF